MAKICPNCNTKIKATNTLYKCPKCGKVVCRSCAKKDFAGGAKCPYCTQRLKGNNRI